MLRNKVFLETDEYDIYMFPIPETALKGKKFLCTVFPRKSVKQWVLSWMEKLHPCFDGRFINDIKIYKENGQIMALVTVAQKMQIAPHLVKKHTAVYVHRPYKRRVFAEKSPVRKLLVIPALAFTIGLAVLSGFSGHGGSVASSKESFSAPHNENVPVDTDIAPNLETAINLEEPEEPAEISLLEVSEAVFCADEQTDFCKPVLAPELPETTEIVEIPAIVEELDYAKSDESEEDQERPLLSESSEQPEVQEPLELSELSQQPELSEPPTPPLPTLSEPPFLDDFLSLIFEAGGTLLNFRWQTSPSASATLTLEGCFPEVVYNCIETLCGESSSGGSQFAETAVFPLLSFSSISYKDNIPSFSLTIDYSSFDLAHAEPRQEQAKTTVPATFRQLIVETGGNVTSESIKPPFISGFVPAPLLCTLSEKVAEHFTESPACGISDVAFDITSASPLTEPEKASILIRAEFGNEKPAFFPLERIASIYPDRDSHKIQFENDEEPQPAQEQLATLASVQIHDAVEIGSVCMEDGTYISFYRKRDGKIIKGDPYEKQKEP